MTAYDRLRAAFRAFFEELFPRFPFLTGYQYTVTSCDYASQTADLQPVSSDLGLPALVAIPIRSPLLMVKLAPGETVVVQFENGDPAYPYVAGLPSAGTGVPVVRQGDVCWVQANLLPVIDWPGGVSTPSVDGRYVISLPVPPPPPFVPLAGGPAKFYGVAATGSQSVKAR